MNFELSTPSLPELETFLNNLLVANKCTCHFINPNKTKILLWKEIKEEQITYHLRIGIQKFIGRENRDRNGEIYWKFEARSEEEKLATKKEPTEAIIKFNQRQIKTEQIHANSSANEK